MSAESMSCMGNITAYSSNLLKPFINGNERPKLLRVYVIPETKGVHVIPSYMYLKFCQGIHVNPEIIQHTVHDPR